MFSINRADMHGYNHVSACMVSQRALLHSAFYCDRFFALRRGVRCKQAKSLWTNDALVATSANALRCAARPRAARSRSPLMLKRNQNYWITSVSLPCILSHGSFNMTG